MTLKERIDAAKSYVDLDDELAAQLSRVLALVEAARECARVRANAECGESDVNAATRGVDVALFALEEAGDTEPTTTVDCPDGRRSVYLPRTIHIPFAHKAIPPTPDGATG